jgi:hypothetical protein
MTAIVVTLVAVAGSSAAVACPQHRVPTTATGAPPASLLSILGVLRRPATPADALPATIGVGLTNLESALGLEIFVGYVRRARVIEGTSYYLVPVHFTGCGRFRSKPSDGIMMWRAGAGGGGVGGGADAAQIEQGRAYGTLGGFTHTQIHMLVPDGVATVTLHYPAGRVGGFDRSDAPAFRIWTNVVGNVMVVTVPRAGNRLTAPMTMTWRAASGTIVKTFSSP